MAEHLSAWSVVQQDDTRNTPSAQELRTMFEKGSDDEKVLGLKAMLTLMLNGEPCPDMLMHIIRFVVPSKNKALKKLLYIYWEVVPKLNDDGKMRQEMLLLCQHLMTDLRHPNEFIRGGTCRFLCKLREAEILEPLIPTLRTCLEHNHAYVRKNAILAVMSIYKAHDFLIPDAPEVIAALLANERHQTCQRNAFVMLMNAKPETAIAFLVQNLPRITEFNELMQLAMIDMIRKDGQYTTPHKAAYLQCIIQLLNASTTEAVKYEAANTLLVLSSQPATFQSAAAAYISLAIKEADNNVKLIVLSRLNELCAKHPGVLDAYVMDILRISSSSPDMTVRRQCLEMTRGMISSRNVEAFASFLKRELIKMGQEEPSDKTVAYRAMLIHAVHQCALKYPDAASSVISVLMDCMGDQTAPSTAVDIIAFIREILEKFPQMRPDLMRRLTTGFRDMRTGRVFRGALWIFGEYAEDPEIAEAALKMIISTVGELPIVASELRERQAEADGVEDGGSAANAGGGGLASGKLANGSTGGSGTGGSSHPRVLADGTYATQTAFSRGGSGASGKAGSAPRAARMAKQFPLRQLLLSGDFFVGAVLSSALTKLVLHMQQPTLAGASPLAPEVLHPLRTQAMLVMASIVRLGQSDLVSSQIDEDSVDRIYTCLRVLSVAGLSPQVQQQPENQALLQIFLRDCHHSYAQVVEAQQKRVREELQHRQQTSQPEDRIIAFRQLQSKKTAAAAEDLLEQELSRATGGGDAADALVSNLNKVLQLTGFSDAVYAEAYVTVHQFDILLDVLIVNQTAATLQNLTLDFSVLGDLKLVERPVPHTLGPHGVHSVKVNVKVASTETGVIFGNIVFDGKSALESHCIILNDIHIDIMDYIKPAYCTEHQFRNMWTEFEWENKVNVSTRSMTDLKAYLHHIMQATNMACLTPERALAGECGFLAANMYAKSIFGEDALANICLEQRLPDTNNEPIIMGHIRIRSKTQGIALSLGDKITLSQKASATT
ncbi:hypothetical protein CXG81DRAFT_13451 [Caulochytrium protostelioides]|uniref:Coatomer subunit beta n=1 Tax=Caulochytrium protostelioides TaxID=1555241 RepID=A0A4P9X572_9FUNG|nr:hypothetical protein CXG81DRAFT_13451 [Caulochytrium protostelioides]|eukprot:RKP00254.1 hypothetical protein CXG81DRAFT_13451 [Caulochytrium protostelioides]